MIALFVFLFGLAFGSFAGIMVTRISAEESVVLPSSHCEFCKTSLKLWHNIPIISYILLRGKCGFCGSKISLFYPIMELLGGIIFVSVYLKSGVGFHFIFVSFTFLFLLVMSVIDLRTKSAPDSINLLAFCMALGASLFGSSSFFETPITPFLFLSRVQDAFVMSGFLLFLKFTVEFSLKKEALGEADILIVGTMGGLLGLKFAMMALFFAALLALISLLLFRKNSDEEQIPFVPFLSIGTFVVYILGHSFDLYMKVFYAL